MSVVGSVLCRVITLFQLTTHTSLVDTMLCKVNEDFNWKALFFRFFPAKIHPHSLVLD